MHAHHTLTPARSRTPPKAPSDARAAAQAEARGVVEGALSALESKWGAAAVWQGQEKDLRVIQVGGGEGVDAEADGA